jgi:hypothetical protein
MKREWGQEASYCWNMVSAIDVCLTFNVAVVFSSKYFRFLFVQHSLQAIGLKIGEAHRAVFLIFLLCKLMFGAPLVMAQGA